VHVVREDLKNPNLLFAGTDVGAYVSLDKGATWTKFMTGLPNVPVHDLAIHPRESELIAATHGRAFWIVDIAPLQQMTTRSWRRRYCSSRAAFQWGEAPAQHLRQQQRAGILRRQPRTASISYRVTGTAGRTRTAASSINPGRPLRHDRSRTPGRTPELELCGHAQAAAEGTHSLRAARLDPARGSRSVVLDSLAKAKYGDRLAQAGCCSIRRPVVAASAGSGRWWRRTWWQRVVRASAHGGERSVRVRVKRAANRSWRRR
jgi:hypothetical protein